MRPLPRLSKEDSLANILITGQLDTPLSNELSTAVELTQQNVYREYTWQNGSFVQVEFPRLYPVNSRGAAEALQEEAPTQEVSSITMEHQTNQDCYY